MLSSYMLNKYKIRYRRDKMLRKTYICMQKQRHRKFTRKKLNHYKNIFVRISWKYYSKVPQHNRTQRDNLHNKHQHFDYAWACLNSNC